MNRCLFILAVGLVTVNAFAKEWHPSREFLQAVRAVESSNGKFLVGDQGRSLGDYQLSEGAWLDVSEWRQKRGFKTYDYEEKVMNPLINRLYAANYLSILHGKLSRKLKRTPSPGEVYAAYNMGIAEFAQCGYNLKRVNPVTRERSHKITQIVRAKQPQS